MPPRAVVIDIPAGNWIVRLGMTSALSWGIG